MLNLQKEFYKFHENIKLDYENQKLHDKREILLKKLKNNISGDAATYTIFNQGSYAMGTGIYPEDEDYDIDAGIKFNINKEDYDNPIVPKKWVKDALERHTKHVAIRRSCVTVHTRKMENRHITLILPFMQVIILTVKCRLPRGKNLLVLRIAIGKCLTRKD